MKKSRVIMRALIYALFLIASNDSMHATILVQGNATTNSATTTFASAVIAKVYDNPTATMIVATRTLPGSAANDYALATVNGTFGNNIPSFTPIAPTVAETLNPIALALATSYGSTSPNIAFTLSTATGNFTPSTSVDIVSLNGATSAASNTLLDASNPIINEDGAATNGVTNIAANANFIFAAVKANSSVTPTIFGTPEGSGIAVVSITPTTLSLNQVPAVASDGGIKAKPFDNTTQQLLLAGTEVNINPNSLPNGSVTQLTYPAMIWDDVLQRLYIGYDVETMIAVGGSSSSGGLSVTAAYLSNAAGTLSLQQMAPAAAVIPNDDTQIIATILDEYCDSYNQECNPVVYYPDGCDPLIPNDCYGNYPPFCYCPEKNLSVHRLAVLHASTGPSYLIVNGGNGTRATTGNLIYALPLVDNPGSTTTHGTFAKKNSALVSGKFVTAATNPGDLATSNDRAAIVGAGPFPIQGVDQLSDLVVVGDTVYASSGEPLSSVTESGIFYSQAMFDETGKIIGWTPWTKRSFPYNGFLNNSAEVGFFSVDAVTGDIWAVDGLAKTSVMTTTWDKGSAKSLVGQLNLQFSGNNSCSNACDKGCYSVLDLDQSTRGFYGNTCSRYALFGGINKVVFTQVSQSLDLYCGQYPGDNILSPQQVMTDFSQPQNLLASTLLECGAVTKLEYSRRGDVALSEDTYNYFYAGTQNGLFVFASPQGNAIDVTNFGNLNEPPFSNGMWFKAPNINGAVIDIKTTGNMLYVLTTSSTASAPLQGTLYRIPFAPTITAMFAASNITTIAQTMTSPLFSSVLRFTGIQIISTNTMGTTEQLVLSTNRGLYQSTRAAGVQGATSQADANWQLVNNSGNNFYLGIGGMNTSVPIAPPSTVWPFNLQDPLGFKTFNRGRIYQLNGTSNTTPFSFVPLFFNSLNSGSASSKFATLDPITYFWSDGGRRFFVINPSKQGCNAPTSNTLLILPFDTTDWDIAQPDQNIDLDPVLKLVDTYNWVQDIGATGIIIAGTNQGVVGLE